MVMEMVVFSHISAGGEYSRRHGVSSLGEQVRSGLGSVAGLWPDVWCWCSASVLRLGSGSPQTRGLGPSRGE